MTFYKVMKFYTSKHMWLENDECGNWEIGITQHGADMMNGVTLVDAAHGPELINQGEDLMTLESRKAVETFPCPFPQAEMLAFNKTVESNPAILDTKADETSICVVKAIGFDGRNPHEYGLLTGSEYRQLVESEKE